MKAVVVLLAFAVLVLSPSVQAVNSPVILIPGKPSMFRIVTITTAADISSVNTDSAACQFLSKVELQNVPT